MTRQPHLMYYQDPPVSFKIQNRIAIAIYMSSFVYRVKYIFSTQVYTT